MSLHLWLSSKRCKECGMQKTTDFFNYTYNVSDMWYSIFPHDEQMVDIDGLTGKQSLSKLNFALQELNKNPDEFIKLNPENGWGNYETFKKFIALLIEVANEHPTYVWKSER